MRRRRQSFGRSVRLYAKVLRLYPEAFRREFGEEMTVAFAGLLCRHGPASAWVTVVRELIPTLAREYRHQVLGRDAVRRGVRVLSAAAFPLLLTVALLRRAERAEEVALVVLWSAGTCLGLARGGGRGWACIFGVVAGSAAGTTAALLYAAVVQGMVPGLPSVAPLMLGVSTAAALAMGCLTRVAMEGVHLTRPPGAGG
jgi:hypothetical protein